MVKYQGFEYVLQATEGPWVSSLFGRWVPPRGNISGHSLSHALTEAADWRSDLETNFVIKGRVTTEWKDQIITRISWPTQVRRCHGFRGVQKSIIAHQTLYLQSSTDSDEWAEGAMSPTKARHTQQCQCK